MTRVTQITMPKGMFQPLAPAAIRTFIKSVHADIKTDMPLIETNIGGGIPLVPRALPGKADLNIPDRVVTESKESRIEERVTGRLLSLSHETDRYAYNFALALKKDRGDSAKIEASIRRSPWEPDTRYSTTFKLYSNKIDHPLPLSIFGPDMTWENMFEVPMEDIFFAVSTNIPGFSEIFNAYLLLCQVGTLFEFAPFNRGSDYGISESVS